MSLLRFSDFPLYSEALKFFKNEDQMVRIAVRTLTLNVFGVDDPDLRKFITDKSAVPYFSNLTWFIRDQCIVLNQTLNKAIYGQQQSQQQQQQQQQQPSTKKDNNNDDDDDDTNNTENKQNEQASKNGHDKSASFIANIKKNKNKKQAPSTQAPKPQQNKTPTNQLQRGVEEQVDHYYYLEV